MKNINYEKITENHSDYNEMNDIFSFLKVFIRENSEDTSKLGQAGWSDEEHRKHNDLIFKIQDGGYSSTIISLKYNFNIMSGYTFSDGNYFLFWNGDFEKLRKCFEDLTLDIKDKESVSKKDLIIH